MRLADFIEQNRKKIIKEWVEFARNLHPWSEGMTDATLRDHAEELVTAIVSDMQSSQSSSQQSQKSKGSVEGGALTTVGRKHATDRLETGFKLNQLVSEYRALRASVVRLWAEAHGDKDGELTRFNEAIDETLAEAAVRYSDIMNHTREQFLAILGHDLRNPLSAMVLGAQALMRSEAIDDKLARIAGRMFNSATRMNRMVGYLLDLARTRLGSTIPIAPAQMDLALVCDQVIAELEVVHPNSQLRFESQGNLCGEWDGDRLTQVISNLVANALQHGEAPVSLTAKDHGDEVELQVHNEGPAISKSALQTIFEPRSRRANHTSDKNDTGLGLGLYIAHEIITAHGGTINVASTDEDGTTFTVKLPRRLPEKKTIGRPSEKRERQSA